MIDPELKDELDRRFNGVADLIAQFAQHLDARIEALSSSVNARFDLLEGQYRRVEARLDSIELQMRAFHKALSDHDRAMPGILSTQAAQQKAIDEIVNRLGRLEHPPQPN